jgi:hypothetical protein
MNLFNIKTKPEFIMVLLVSTFTLSYPAYAVIDEATQQLGARGKVQRMIVNHRADNDEIAINTTDPSATCQGMTLRTNDPNVSRTSYKTLYTYLLAAKLTGKTLEFFTDMSCHLFRLEIID